MFRFFLKLIIGGIIILAIILGLAFIGNQWFKKELNPLAIVKDAFQNLVNQYFPSRSGVVEIPLPEKEENREIESPEIEEEIEEEEEIEPTPELTLIDIADAIDEISERVDLLSQEIDSLIREREKEVKIQEVQEETEEIEKAEEKEEEIEEPKEEKIEQKEIILCQRGELIPIRNEVIFNEIAWMGTINSANNEWIELKNISGSEINLAGWQLLDKDNQIKIIFNNQPRVLSNGFYLLERTDDDSVPNISADKIYTGALNDTDEALYLFNQNCQLEDEVLANPDWPAGDKIYKRTMERKNDLNWQTSTNPGGTPKAENSSGYVEYYGGGGGTPSPSYPKILISEIQISPIGERFIELYNPNNSEVNLTGWYIQRKTKTGTSWGSLVSSTKFEGKTIQPKSHFLIAKTDGNAEIVLDLTLTEDNTLVFKNPNREIVDKVGWGELSQDFENLPAENPPTGKSIGRIWDEENQTYFDQNDNSVDFEIQKPSPKEQNQSPLPPSLP